jgi:hypothetical protein
MAALLVVEMVVQKVDVLVAWSVAATDCLWVEMKVYGLAVEMVEPMVDAMGVLKVVVMVQ